MQENTVSLQETESIPRVHIIISAALASLLQVYESRYRETSLLFFLRSTHEQ